MSKPFPLRSWATRVTMGSFLLMAGTGVLMFFELDGGLTAVPTASSQRAWRRTDPSRCDSSLGRRGSMRIGSSG